jgi:hypothetical protein
MATFTKFLDILPDPNVKVGAAGQQDQTSGTAGQGFASVSLREIKETSFSRTLTGRLIDRSNKAARWAIDLTYNPMTRAQFNPVYNFIQEKQNGRHPFYIILPTYKLPKDSAFATYVQSNPIVTTEAKIAGNTTIEIEDTSDTAGTTLPTFGDLFYFEDSEDTLHTKTYMVSRVETQDTYQTGNQPGTASVRLHFSPRLTRNVSNGANVVFNSPLIQVEQVGDLQEYELNNDGLYIFSLRLEEVWY